MKINSVLIVGGGSSGWMTAAALTKMFGDDIKISLIEGKNSSPVGVGESTIILFNRFLDLVGLKDTDWMRHCNATYKTSIRFTNFREGKGEVFEYPFGGFPQEETMMLWSVLNAKYNLGPESFCEFHNDPYFLAKHNRLTKNLDEKLRFNFKMDTAYHFDAGVFGQFLKKKICDPGGTTHYVDDVVAFEKDDRGYLASVVGDSGQKYSADLFIDCTGFKSLLLEKEMESEYISYKPWLSNDRAIATHLPYTNKKTQLTNVTNCTALSSGCSWNIPLWKRMGTGYVYSSDFIDDDSAEKEFKKHIGTEDVDIRKIRIRHGVRKKGWVKNVVGVGLSYGFVEPLESTGLVSTHAVIDKLVELLDRRELNPTRFDIDCYNHSCQKILNGYREFVAMHYRISPRNDTPYWKYQTEEKDWTDLKDDRLVSISEIVNNDTVYEGFEEYLYRAHGDNHRWDSERHGYSYILAGMGHKPYGKYLFNQIEEMNAPEWMNNIDKVYQEWREHVRITEGYVKTLPTSFEFLKKYIYS